MQRIEVQHFTFEQVRQHVGAALQIATDDGIPNDLREAVFVESLRLLGAKTVQAVTAPQGMFVPPIG